VYFAGCGGVAFGAEKGEGTTAVFEDGIEKDAQAGGVFDVVRGVAEPGCAEGGRGSCGEKGRRNSWNGRGRGVGVSEISLQFCAVGLGSACYSGMGLVFP
jgi:hypothetical protein